MDRTNAVTGEAYDSEDEDEDAEKRPCCCLPAHPRLFTPVQQHVTQQEVMNLVENDELDITFGTGGS